MTSKRSKTLKLKLIAVDEQNYFILKKLGTAGDSFNDVIKKILRKQRLAQSSRAESMLEASTTQGVSDTTSNE